VDRKSLSTLSYGFFAALHVAIFGSDVAIVMNVANGFWLPILKFRGVKTLVNVDGIEWERDKWSPLGKKVFHLGARAVARYADRIVCDSVEIGKYWQEKFGRRGVFIPYGGVPFEVDTFTEPFKPFSYILVVARLVPENSIGEFLDAVVYIPEEIPIVVVGSSGYGQAYEQKLKIFSETRANFHWLGHLSDDKRLNNLWANAGIYFHGHSVGGTNPALIQAMTCGAAVLARDTVFNREVLGDSGVFVPASTQEIASELSRLMNNAQKRTILGQKAKVRAENHYTWYLVNDLYLKEVLGLAGLDADA
jgi:glycosyltransferase involved in cell wall biosynthesis